jgi:hypothetical protein
MLLLTKSLITFYKTIFKAEFCTDLFEVPFVNRCTWGPTSQRVFFSDIQMLYITVT